MLYLHQIINALNCYKTQKKNGDIVIIGSSPTWIAGNRHQRFFFQRKYTPRQIRMESNDPNGAAMPIGVRWSGYQMEA